MKRERLRFFTLLLSLLLLFGCLVRAAYADVEQETEEKHTHEYVLVETCEPTCMEKGYNLYACVDGDHSYFDYIDPLSHDWDAGRITVEIKPESIVEMESESEVETKPEPEAEPEPEPIADPESDPEAEGIEPEIAEVEGQVTEEKPAEAPEEEPAAQGLEETEETAEETPFIPETDTQDTPEEQPDSEQPVGEDDESEETTPTWSIQLPDNPPITYGAEIMNISAAVAVNVENLGDSTIYLTITSNCIFTGNTDSMPITLCVGGVPVTSGEPVVYGTVTSAGANYMPVSLVFSEEGWIDLSSGNYSMSIQYDSYVA